MGELRSKDKYKGTIGELVFVEMNGKTYVRKKRSKMTKIEKKRQSWQGTVIQNNRFSYATALAKILREPVPKYSSYSHLHSRLSGVINKLIQLDHIHDKENFRLLPEHFHLIKEVKTNDDFPEKLMDALRNAKVELRKNVMKVSVKRLPLAHLNCQPEKVEVWVNLQVIELGDHPEVIFKERQKSGAIPISGYGDLIFELHLPPLSENSVTAVMIGLMSFQDGHQVKDLEMNGFVFGGGWVV
jgi:hypothetical protein